MLRVPELAGHITSWSTNVDNYFLEIGVDNDDARAAADCELARLGVKPGTVHVIVRGFGKPD